MYACAERATEGNNLQRKRSPVEADTEAVVPACASSVAYDEAIMSPTELSSGSLILPQSPAVEPDTQEERYACYLAGSSLQEIAQALERQRVGNHPKVCLR